MLLSNNVSRPQTAGNAETHRSSRVVPSLSRRPRSGEVARVEAEVELPAAMAPVGDDISRRRGEVRRVVGELLAHERARRLRRQAERLSDLDARLVGVAVGKRLAWLAVQVPRLVREDGDRLP